MLGSQSVVPRWTKAGLGIEEEAPAAGHNDSSQEDGLIIEMPLKATKYPRGVCRPAFTVNIDA